MGTTGYKAVTPQDTIGQKFDFYSGSQITIWFGNVMLDDITSIQWYRTQNKLPLYGYASQMFDSVANGIVSIQGNFTINFRQTGYISAVVNEIQSLYQAFVPGSPSSKNPFEADTWPVVSQLIGLHLRNGTFGPQTAADIKELGNSDDFFAQAKLYEQIIWGDSEMANASRELYNQSPDITQSTLLPDGFNILITYGNPAQTDVSTVAQSLKSTTKALNGVHLIGSAQMIQVGGQPIQEQYSFIARSTDDYAGSTR